MTTATDLTERQRQMLLASVPDDITGDEGVGIELRTGADYAVAKALQAKGFGHVSGPGGSLPGMYWNGGYGLHMRRELRGEFDEGGCDD